MKRLSRCFTYGICSAALTTALCCAQPGPGTPGTSTPGAPGSQNDQSTQKTTERAGSQTGSGEGRANDVSRPLTTPNAATTDTQAGNGGGQPAGTGPDAGTYTNNLRSKEPYRDENHNFSWIGLLGLGGLAGLFRRRTSGPDRTNIHGEGPRDTY